MREWLRGMGYWLRWEWDEAREGVYCFIAWHAPRRLVMWCALRVGAHATTGPWSDQNVAALTFIEALQRWDKAHEADPRESAPLPPSTSHQEELS